MPLAATLEPWWLRWRHQIEGDAMAGAEDQRAALLTRRVAEAADAWLRDPLDAAIYQRLVDATLAWRAHAHPALEGLENAGRIDDPPTLAATLPHVTRELRQRAQAPAD